MKPEGLSKATPPFVATYRLQLYAGFGFADAQALLPYFTDLGVSHLYLSPVWQARPGSSHGYDGADHARISDELGGEADFRSLAAAAREAGLGIILDFVPNHAVTHPSNPRFYAMLERGRRALEARCFDVYWDEPLGDAGSGGRDAERERPVPGRLVLPVLGRSFAEEARDGALRIVATWESGRLELEYYEHRIPLSPEACARVLESSPAFAEISAALRQWSARFPVHLDLREDPDRAGTAARELLELQNDLCDRLQRDAALQAELQTLLDEWNDLAGDERGAYFTEVHALCPWQAMHWRQGARVLNYRRFFNINDLISLRQEDRYVFDETHGLLSELAREGLVQGIRIDHVDGLYDPQQYLRWLSDAAGEAGQFLWPEKILASGEELFDGGPGLQGATGYEFLNEAGFLFVDSVGLRRLERLYRSYCDDPLPFAELAREASREVIASLFPAELDRLRRRLRNVDPERAPDESVLETTLIEITANLEVYRTYAGPTDLLQLGQAPAESIWRPEDRRVLERALQAARDGGAPPEGVDFFAAVCFPESGGEEATSRETARARADFLSLYQQFTGPVMAKGHEDTALYRHALLLALQNVGGDPENRDFTRRRLHDFLQKRRERWPLAMNASSTHDAKRSEDVRARLQAVSQNADWFEAAFHRWTQQNQARLRRYAERPVPDPTLEFFLYQTLAGSWPLDPTELEEYRARIQAYILKVVREAKQETDWENVSPEYEAQLQAFLDDVFSGGKEDSFAETMAACARWTARAGALNSLGALLLKIASPGLPDFYQGTELWDFSLVDPDNRRPVDFVKRRSFLADLQTRLAETQGRPEGRSELCAELLRNREDGRVKLLVALLALRKRRAHPELFSAGAYAPLAFFGPRSREDWFGFVRGAGDSETESDPGTVQFLVLLPCIARIRADADEMEDASTAGKAPGVPGEEARAAAHDLPVPDTEEVRVEIPENAARKWRSVWTGEVFSVDERGELALAGLTRDFPLVFLERAD